MRTPHGKSRWILLAAGLWLAASAVAWAAEHPAAGHWEGAIELPGTKLEVLVDLKAGGRGSLYGTVSIPKQNAKDLPLANVTAEGAKISFEIQGIPGTPTFSGEVKGDAFAGDFTQGGKSFPFSLERKDDPAAAARRAMEGFDPVVEDAMKRFDVPGLAIAVVKGKDVVYAKGFGFRDVEKQLPVTPDTLFAIGSSTKAFTAFVLGTLVDEGRVDWDTPVRTYIPWFKLYDPSASERITPRDLLTHRSGLPRHDLAWYNNNDITREEVVRRLAYLEPSADLREKFQYNNMMYLTAGYLAETLTGMTWEQAVRTRVLDPAGMTRTNFDVAVSERDADAAQPYAKKDDKVVKVPFRPIVAPGPAGSINSTADDMARWAIVHLNGGKIGDVRVANASTVEEMHIPRMTTGATPDEPEITPPDYALG